MKRIIAIGLLLVLAACSPAENSDASGSGSPALSSGAPLNDEAIGPSDSQTQIEEGGD